MKLRSMDSILHPGSGCKSVATNSQWTRDECDVVVKLGFPLTSLVYMSHAVPHRLLTYSKNFLANPSLYYTSPAIIKSKP